MYIPSHIYEDKENSFNTNRYPAQNLTVASTYSEPNIQSFSSFVMWFAAAKLVMGGSKVTYILLNIIRGLNILSILACELAAGSILVKTADLSIGWFNVFDLAEKVLIMVFGLFLLMTEMPKVLRGYIGRNWPLFGHASEFFTFSIGLLFLGCDVLSYLTKEDADAKHLGNDFYRMCQAAGLMAVIMTPINLIATLTLQDRRRGLTARQVRGFKREFQEEA